jgi:YD repeat-containing protein
VALEHPSGRSTTYGYDERSRRTSEAWLDENGALVRIVHLAYDGADRNVEIRDGLTSVLARDYVEGRLAQLRYGNGFVRRHDYAPDDGSLRSTETRDASGNVVEST